jgi:hypothetical protein
LVIDGDLRARAAELRREWQADEELWARVALERFQHARSLLDVLRDAMHRGDVVLLGAGPAPLRGVVAHVGTDWCALDTVSGPVDVHVAGDGAPLVRVVERAVAGGRTRDPGAAASWRARLLEHETAGRRCAVGLAGDLVTVGRLRLGADHLAVVGDEPDCYVPIAASRWVRVVTGA